MNFDIAVCAGLAIVAVIGFNTGLLRSAITILAYVLSRTVAIGAMTFVSSLMSGNSASPLLQNWILFFGALLVVGMMFGKIARMALDETMGANLGIGDRLGGAALGAVRVLLIATSRGLVFDRLGPNDPQPAFLQGAPPPPLPSAAGQRGLPSPPPHGAGP